MPELVVQAEAWIAFFTRVRRSKAIGVIASIDEPAPAAGGRQGKVAARSPSRRPEAGGWQS